jgi:hypothetical protein
VGPPEPFECPVERSLILDLDFHPARFPVPFFHSPDYRGLLILSTLLHFPPLNLRDQIVSLFSQLRFGPLKKLLVLTALRLDQFFRVTVPENAESDIHESEMFQSFRIEGPDNLVAIGGRTVNDFGSDGSILEPFRPIRSVAFKRRFDSPFLGVF